jgi:cell division protein FtsB
LFVKERNRETFLRLLVVSLLLDMLISFGAARFRLNTARAEEQALSTACAALREENDGLRQQLAAARQAEGLEDMARDRLGLVMPGEKVFYFR